MSDGGSRRVESDGGACAARSLPPIILNHRPHGVCSSLEELPCVVGLPRSVPGASPRMRRLCRYTMCTRLPQPDEPVRVALAAPPLGGRSAVRHCWRDSRSCGRLRPTRAFRSGIVRRVAAAWPPHRWSLRWWKSQRGLCGAACFSPRGGGLTPQHLGRRDAASVCFRTSQHDIAPPSPWCVGACCVWPPRVDGLFFFIGTDLFGAWVALR